MSNAFHWLNLCPLLLVLHFARMTFCAVRHTRETPLLKAGAYTSRRLSVDLITSISWSYLFAHHFSTRTQLVGGQI